MNPAIILLALTVNFTGVDTGPIQPVIDKVVSEYSMHGSAGYRPAMGLVLAEKKVGYGYRQISINMQPGKVMLIYKERF